MRIAIAGAGAVGGYFGARFAAAGHRVVFMARGSHANAIRERGLRVTGLDVPFHLPEVTLYDPAERDETADLILVCTKRYDTERILRDAAQIIGSRTVGLSLQNGIDAAEQLAPHFATGQVIAGATYVFATIGEPGEIVIRAPMTQILFGELSGADSSRCQILRKEIDVPGVEPRLSGDMQTELWRKFCFVTPHAGAAAYYRAHAGQIRANPEARAVFCSLAAETVAIGRSQGAALGDDTETDLVTFLDSVPNDARASMLMDLINGKPLELEWLTGAVVRLGKASGIATPASCRVYEALLPSANGGMQKPASI